MNEVFTCSLVLLGLGHVANREVLWNVQFYTAERARELDLVFFFRGGGGAKKLGSIYAAVFKTQKAWFMK